MASKKTAKAQITGFMTVAKTSGLPMETKQKILSVSDGQERRFRKVLLDKDALLAVLDEETAAKVLAALNDHDDLELALDGRAYIGGMKDGKPAQGRDGKDRNQSLTCRVAFKVSGLESYVTASKAEKVDDAEAANDLAAALTD